MKTNISIRTIAIFSCVFLVLFIMLINWTGYRKVEQQVSIQKAVPMQQKKSALLAGISKAVAYSGFRHGQHPDRGNGAINPSDADILEDLRILSRHANFGLIRLYDSQENSESVLKVIKANKINMKVLLGIWLSAEISNKNCPWLKEPIPQLILEANKIQNKKEIENGIRLAKEYPDIVVAVNVGNEALVSWNDHLVSLDSVITYVKKVKNSISQPVTVADNFAWWVESGSALAQVVDFIMVHTYPLWDGRDIGEALSYSIANIQAVRNVLPNKRMIIGEAGWATIATEFGERASEEKQKRYIHELTDWAAQMNISVFIFEAFDEDWKGETANPMAAEKHWGLFTVDRKAKLVMADLYPDLVPVKDPD